MKTILTLVLLMVNLICVAANTKYDPNVTLTIEGKYIAEKNVRYEVYMINADSTLTFMSKGKSMRYFSINVEIGEHYLIKFTSRDNEVKYLYVDAPENGEFMVDVDFSRKGSATMTYSPRSKKYLVKHVPNKEICYARNEEVH